MARAPHAREWRLRGEGLRYGCTEKGSKEGAVNVNFIVGISYGSGVILCEQYEGPITTQKFADIVTASFPAALEKCANPTVRGILQDGCPRQNRKIAREAVSSIGGMIMLIPARSPDRNPIENFFHLVWQQLEKNPVDRNITKETFHEFSVRVKDTMVNFDIVKIDKIICSMSKRVDVVIKSKGQRIKY